MVQIMLGINYFGLRWKAYRIFLKTSMATSQMMPIPASKRPGVKELFVIPAIKHLLACQHRRISGFSSPSLVCIDSLEITNKQLEGWEVGSIFSALSGKISPKQRLVIEPRQEADCETATSTAVYSFQLLSKRAERTNVRASERAKKKE